MSTAGTAPSTLPPGIERGKKYRFVVRSAEEAIATLRERMGEEAKVLSVKQVDGTGLGRFMSSPKLEIIATVPEQEALPAPAPEPAAAAQPAPAGKRPAPAQQGTAPEPAVDPARAELEQELASEPAPQAPRRNPYTRKGGDGGRSDVWTVLRKAGFAENLLNSLHYGVNGVKLEDMPLPRALAEINRRLRQDFQDVPQRPLSSRIAFFGTPGVGKTTALCKRLASDVFLERRNVEVLKLDCETPNPDDALSLFCDVLGVPLLRDPVEPTYVPEGDVLYVDLPGVPLHEQNQWRTLRARLDVLGVETRVLVVHGLYEADLISASFDLGERMGATHIVLTHLDELANGTKLWPFILRGGLTPFFASHGQNVTSDYSDDVLRILLEKTFPATLIQ